MWLLYSCQRKKKKKEQVQQLHKKIQYIKTLLSSQLYITSRISSTISSASHFSELSLAALKQLQLRTQPRLLKFQRERGTSTRAQPKSSTRRNRPHVLLADDAIAFSFCLQSKKSFDTTLILRAYKNKTTAQRKKQTVAVVERKCLFDETHDRKSLHEPENTIQYTFL